MARKPRKPGILTVKRRQHGSVKNWLDTLSPGYRRKVEKEIAAAKAEKRAVELRRARGHKAGEHIERREREKREIADPASQRTRTDYERRQNKLGKYSRRQLAEIEAFADQAAGRHANAHERRPSQAQLRDWVRNWVMARGWDSFVFIRRTQAEFEAQKEAAQLTDTGWIWGQLRPLMNELVNQYGLPTEWMLYYH